MSPSRPCSPGTLQPPYAAFSSPLPLLPRTNVETTSRRRRPARWAVCAENSQVPNSPNVLVRSWQNSRKISSTVDLSRRFISVLFLSNRCERAAFAEKQLAQIAEQYSISRRLLILSAGIDSIPGDPLPFRVIQAAYQRGIDLCDEKPCASFEITDLDYYDFVVVVDRNARDKLLRMAEVHAHTSGGHLYEWERKIRLLCDFDGSLSERQMSAGLPMDVPRFSSLEGAQSAMNVMKVACESLVRSLLAAGL